MMLDNKQKKSKNKTCRSCRTECKFGGILTHHRRYDQDGNEVDELLFVAKYLQN